MIRVDSLVFEYPGIRALDDVSCRIVQGSITALAGPNGAGKTTLLRCMAALEQPLAGSIRIDGIDVQEKPRACHRAIGYLSDSFGLYHRLTVRQCLLYIAAAQGVPDEDGAAAVDDVSRRLQIEDRLDMRPGELSRGLRQRVAIAQAIIHKPRVLLLDEPASGLDPEARHELEHLFIGLQAQGMTLLVSSHILAELENYCTDLLVLRNGRLVEHTELTARNRMQNFKLVLAEPVHDLPAVLRRLQGIEPVSITDDRQALLHVPNDRHAQHELLKAMLALNLAVCEFAPTAGNLQDTYLETVRRQS